LVLRAAARTSLRWEARAFAHECFGDKDSRDGTRFINDQGRIIAYFAAEAVFGPVPRVETVGMLARSSWQ